MTLSYTCKVTLQLHAPEQRDMDKMFCCFQSNTVELTPIVCSWSITDTDSVLCEFEDWVILQSLAYDTLP